MAIGRIRRKKRHSSKMRKMNSNLGSRFAEARATATLSGAQITGDTIVLGPPLLGHVSPESKSIAGLERDAAPQLVACSSMPVDFLAEPRGRAIGTKHP